MSVGYLKTLHKAHIQYCKYIGQKPVGYSAFAARWQEEKNKDNFITLHNRGLGGNRAKGKTIKERWAEYVKKTGEDISYAMYRRALHKGIIRLDTSTNIDTYKLIHNTINKEYSCNTSGLHSRLKNSIKYERGDFEEVLTIPNTGGKGGYIFASNRIEDIILESGLDLRRYLKLKNNIARNIKQYVHTKDQIYLSYLEKYGDELRKDFYSIIFKNVKPIKRAGKATSFAGLYTQRHKR